MPFIWTLQPACPTSTSSSSQFEPLSGRIYVGRRLNWGRSPLEIQVGYGSDTSLCNWSLTQSPLILNLTRNKDLALGLRVVANELVVSGGREEKSGGALVDGEQWPLS